MLKSVISTCAAALFIVGMSGMAEAQQYIRACGKVSPLTPQGERPLEDASGRPFTGTSYLEYIPSLCVSERYDTNVFFAPPSPGLNRADFVTNVNPALRVNHNGGYASGYLDVGGFGETYVRNPDLNFFGTVDTLFVNLDNSIKRLLPNASLSLTEYVRYTPTPPGFINPAAGTSPSAPVNINNVYAQGILSQRTNNFMNNFSALTTYKITPLTSFNAQYSNMILRFGSSPVASGVALFDSDVQTGTVGAATQVSPADTLNLNYSHTISEFAQHSTTTSVSAQSNTFTTDNVSVGWVRDLTPYLTGTVGGGVIRIDPGLVTYAANASLKLNTPSNLATISYARSAYPSFVGVGVPVVSDTFLLSAIQKLSRHWELDENLSYAHASGGSGVDTIKYDSFFASMDLYYFITRIWSTGLSFDYMNFHQETGTTKSNFDRYVVTLSVKATWN